MRDDLKEKGRGNVGPARNGWICRAVFRDTDLGCYGWHGAAERMRVAEQSTTHSLSSPMNMLLLSRSDVN